MTEKEKKGFMSYGAKDFLNYLDRKITDEEYNLFIDDLNGALDRTFDEEGELTDGTYFLEDLYDNVLDRTEEDDDDKYYTDDEFYEEYYAHNDALYHKYYYGYPRKDNDKE